MKRLKLIIATTLSSSPNPNNYVGAELDSTLINVAAMAVTKLPYQLGWSIGLKCQTLPFLITVPIGLAWIALTSYLYGWGSCQNKCCCLGFFWFLYLLPVGLLWASVKASVIVLAIIMIIIIPVFSESKCYESLNLLLLIPIIVLAFVRNAPKALTIIIWALTFALFLCRLYKRFSFTIKSLCTEKERAVTPYNVLSQRDLEFLTRD